MRDPRPEFDYNKADSRWRLVVWMGKVETSDGHIGASGSETEKCRTVRRRPEAERWVRARPHVAAITAPRHAFPHALAMRVTSHPNQAALGSLR